MLFESQVYLDEKIGSSPELIQEGIRKAKVAYLLDTKNSKSYQNYLNLLYLDSPSQALMKWSHLVDGSAEGISLGNTILRKSLKCLRDQSLDLKTKILISKNAISQFQSLQKVVGWDTQPQNLLLGAEILAETGNHKQALGVVEEVLKEDAGNSDAVFLLTRLVVHLKDKAQLVRLGKLLAPLSSQRSEEGVGSNSSHDTT